MKRLSVIAMICATLFMIMANNLYAQSYDPQLAAQYANQTWTCGQANSDRGSYTDLTGTVHQTNPLGHAEYLGIVNPSMSKPVLETLKADPDTAVSAAADKLLKSPKYNRIKK